MSRARILVIGGGLAGLQAALHCVDSGAEVVLLESRKRLGGATWSNHHRRMGFEIDNGQHVFMRCCDHYLAFLDRLGMSDCVDLQDRLEVPIARPGHPLAFITSAALPAPAHLAPSLLRFPTLSIRQRLQAGRTALRMTRLDPEEPSLDDRSFGDWLVEQGESPQTIDSLWDLLIRPTLNTPVRETSLALAARVLRTGFLDSVHSADIGWSRLPFEQLHARPARRVLEARGARVLTGMRVDSIEANLDGPVRVWANGGRLDADAVILAVPHEVAARLLPGAANFERKALAELPSSPIVNLHAVFDRKITDQRMLVGMGTDLEWIFDRSEAAGLDEDQYLSVSLSAADRWLGSSTSELQEVFSRQFISLFPRAREARMHRFAVTIERAATFRAIPGTRRIRPDAGSRIAGIHLAGAWTHTGWPATMEGAVRSGLAAARNALASQARTGTRSQEAA